MFVKPALEGAIVRDPATHAALPAEGAVVPDTSYWRRRLHFGEIVETKRPRANKEAG